LDIFIPQRSLYKMQIEIKSEQFVLRG